MRDKGAVVMRLVLVKEGYKLPMRVTVAVVKSPHSANESYAAG